ncbi:hypothetical protein HYU09_04800 [Candidatus Woesearchaeota archaeon]|nr:hypothetical protein [Candidatus Woesearchaeota archaeon]
MGPKEFEAVKTLLNTGSNGDGRLPTMHQLPDPHTKWDEFIDFMSRSPILALEGNGNVYRVIEVTSGSASFEFDKTGLLKKVTFKGKAYHPNGNEVITQLDAWCGYERDSFTDSDLERDRVHYIPRSY